MNYLLQNITLLYIDRDVAFRSKYARILEKEGIKVLELDDCLHAPEVFQKNHINILILNIELSNDHGLNFLQFLHEKKLMIPIITTATDIKKETLLEAVNHHIISCLMKPFSELELFDAIDYSTSMVLNSQPLAFTSLHNGYSYDPINKSINSPDGNSIQLTKKEYLLIELLLSNTQQTIPYETIEDVVWENDDMSMDALRTLTCSIRKKVYPDLLQNANGIGYRIDL